MRADRDAFNINYLVWMEHLYRMNEVELPDGQLLNSSRASIASISVMWDMHGDKKIIFSLVLGSKILFSDSSPYISDIGSRV